MRIPDDLSKVSGIYGTQKNTARVGKTEATAAKKDVLSISNEAKDYQTVYKALKDVPDVRESKVTELSEKFETGSYNVTGREVADKVVNAVFDKKA
jgi:negative regulator of flagellin synthesis FlgM